jgi:radical SAM protein with 4Fe4S-binding SPASM domain
MTLFSKDMGTVITKYINAARSAMGWLGSSVLHRAIVSGMPPAIGVELTNCCNLACPECASGSGTMKRPRGYMDISMFSALMDELGNYLLNINLYFQGEPMLHPGFFDFLERSSGNSVTVSTNGHYLTVENCNKIAASQLKKLIISLDGFDQETYSKYRRRGNLEAVLDGIRNVSTAKMQAGSDLKVEIQLVVNRYNEKQIPDIRQFAENCGASLTLKTMQICDNDNSWIPTDLSYSRYISDNGRLKLKNNLPRRCARLWFNPVVTWDGKVIPCCFDKDADHVMGDLKTQSFREIWHGAGYKEFRNKVLSGREKIEICRNCTSGMSGKNT